MGFIAKVGAAKDAELVSVSATSSVRVHRPAAPTAPGPALLWMHGGGYIMGGAGHEDGFCRKLAHLAGITVALGRIPACTRIPLSCGATRLLRRIDLAGRATLGRRISAGRPGASAGGGLAAALAILARDRGELLPSCQLLAHPMLDDRTGARADTRRRILWSGNDNREAWRLYLAGTQPASAVPARCTDLTGIPPAWIGVGTLDLFYQESLDYGRRLGEAGTPVQVEAIDGAFDTFDMIVPNARPSLHFLAS